MSKIGNLRIPLPQRLAPLAFVLLVVGCETGDKLSRLQPTIEASPNPLVFDSMPVGVRTELAVDIRNVGGSALELTSIRLEASSATDFSLGAGAEPQSIAPGTTVSLKVGLTPSDIGAADGAVLIDSNDPETPTLRVPLQATRRTGPVLSLCVESLEIPLERVCGTNLEVDFGDTPVGEYRGATFSLYSVGTDPIDLSEISLTGGGFVAEVPTAGRLAAGEGISFEIRATPTTVGALTGRLVATSNGGNAGANLAADAVEPALCLNPVLLDFGGVAVGQSAEATATAFNCGQVDLSLSSIEVLGDAPFALTQPLTAPVPLPPVANLGFQATFRYQPEVDGEALARARFTTDRGDAILTLQGASDACKLVALPSPVSFTLENPFQFVLVSNAGSQACTVTSINVDDPNFFMILDRPNLPVTVQPGAGFELAITAFSDIRVRTTQLRIGVTEAADLTVDMSVSPFGNVGPCSVNVEPRSLSFGLLAPGRERASLLTLSANGARCELTSIGLSADSDDGFDAEAPGPLPFQLGFDQIKVWFRPTEGSGPVTGTLELGIDGDDIEPTTVTVDLFGITNAPALCVAPETLDFGVAPGGRTQAIQLTACGARSVTVSQLSFPTSDGEISLENPPALPLVLPAGDTQTLTVLYAPTDAEGDTAVLRIASDDPARPEIDVRITGGAQVVPPDAGRFLYLWQISPAGFPLPPPDDVRESEISIFPLQGRLQVEPYYGPRNGKQCSGCHSVSPDGRYVAISVNTTSLAVVDNLTGTETPIPQSLDSGLFVTWNPNVETTPPYQFAYAANDGDIHIASLYTGEIRTLQGADDARVFETMPTWGPDGRIAFVRTQGPGGIGFQGTSELYIVPEAGGVAEPITGASGGNVARYYPAFSRDGRWIAYTHSASANSSIAARDARIEMVAADNSGTVLTYPDLNVPGSANSYPTWSVDGRFLSFSSDRPGGAGSWDVYLVPFETRTGTVGDVTPISALNSPLFQHAVQWSP